MMFHLVRVYNGQLMSILWVCKITTTKDIGKKFAPKKSAVPASMMPLPPKPLLSQTPLHSISSVFSNMTVWLLNIIFRQFLPICLAYLFPL